MASHVLMFGWNRAIPGRERISAAHFGEFVTYLGALKQKGVIEMFQPVFLEAHGGDLNGFFLLSGEGSKLDALTATTEWITHLTRAALHLEGAGAIRGVTGDEIATRMEMWTQAIPA